jgi:DNA-binding response OmpR family regulator
MAKVLYVDADRKRAEIVCAVFARRGHAVTLAAATTRAMMYVDREGGYEAVVAHLMLPSVDGAELCRWLQNWSGMAGVPRVVFSSPGTRLRLDLADRLPRWLPADMYLRDLTEFEQLVDAVEWLLDRKGNDGTNSPTEDRDRAERPGDSTKGETAED